MKPIRLASFLLALGLPFLAGCRTTVGGYFEDRLYDFVDIVPVNVSWGPGFYVGARATALAGVGIGYSETTRAGSHRRPTWSDDPFELVNFRTWDETQKGVAVLWTRDADPNPGAGNILIVPVIDRENDWRFRAWIDPGSALDAEAEFHLVWVGLRIGASPIQALDWLLGWTTLDVLGDDLNGRFEGRREPVRVEPGASDSTRR